MLESKCFEKFHSEKETLLLQESGFSQQLLRVDYVHVKLP